MADKPSPKKRTKKTVKRKTAGKRPERKNGTARNKTTHNIISKTREQLKTMGEKFGETTDKGMHDTLDSTRKQLWKLGEKLYEAKDKGIHIAKEIAEEVQRFATDATELTRLKLEIHNMKKDRDNLLMLMGEKLKNMYHAGRLSNVRSKFQYDFNKLEELEAQIIKKEKEAKGRSMDIKAI
jgi:hypothetical protein